MGNVPKFVPPAAQTFLPLYFLPAIVPSFFFNFSEKIPLIFFLF